MTTLAPPLATIPCYWTFCNHPAKWRMWNSIAPKKPIPVCGVHLNMTVDYFTAERCITKVAPL